MYGAGIATKLIGGGIAGGLGGIQSNALRQQIIDAYSPSNMPDVPDLNHEFLGGYFQQIQDTPQLLALDRSMRDQYAQSDANRGAQIYANTLPQYAQANLRTLNRIDPQFQQGRSQLFGTVSNDLAAGSSLTPELQQQLQQYVRAGQSARGNYLGNGPVAEEAFAQGAAGQQLKQQRIGNMESFLRGPSPEDKFAQLAGGGASTLTASAASASNPGYSYIEGPHDWAGQYARDAQTQYQDQLTPDLARAAAIAGAPPPTNPWLASLAGASGAVAGSSGSGMGGGGGGGGGGMNFGSMMGGGGGGGQNVSWSSGYNGMMG